MNTFLDWATNEPEVKFQFSGLSPNFFMMTRYTNKVLRSLNLRLLNDVQASPRLSKTGSANVKAVGSKLSFQNLKDLDAHCRYPAHDFAKTVLNVKTRDTFVGLDYTLLQVSENFLRTAK